MTESKVWFRDSQEAFRRAIAEERLSANPEDPHYAGNYMYMGTAGDLDYFKHKMTREYVAEKPEVLESAAMFVHSPDP